ncbi:MAG: ATPase, T2SS/T4P/T4SS family [Eubacterium sp.]|nr:ATPase, T2SS/T4P/T4SS family [Eubacterium sp.]
MLTEEDKERFRKELMRELEDGDERDDEQILDLIDAQIQGPMGRSLSLNLRQKEELRRTLFYSVRRLDILQELMDDPAVTEIMVNGYQSVFYEKNGRLIKWDKAFPSRERYENILQQVAGRCNRVVNEQRPVCDARLEDGSRVNIVMSPVALNGPALTIRRFPEESITMENLIELGSISREAADFLKRLVRARYSILIGGGTSTGKTTFLNALSSCIPHDERIVTIEDTAELQIQGIDDLVTLEARSANLEGVREITIRDLIKTALRMRPDRIIVGEVRGEEAEDFLMCLNTGHDGSLGTAHANSTREMIVRLETMVMMGNAAMSPEVIRRQIVSGIEILVHLERDADGKRYVSEIAELVGDDAEIRPLYRRFGEGDLEPCEELLGREKLEKYDGAKKNK